jgi:hypothetical protein
MRGTLQLVSKLSGQGRRTAIAARQLINKLDQNKTPIGAFSWIPVHHTASSYTILLYLPRAPSFWPNRSAHSLLGRTPGQLLDQDFSWKFLLANVAFHILDFLRFHKLLIDSCSKALLVQPAVPTVTVLTVDRFCTAILPTFGEALFSSSCSTNSPLSLRHIMTNQPGPEKLPLYTPHRRTG